MSFFGGWPTSSPFDRPFVCREVFEALLTGLGTRKVLVVNVASLTNGCSLNALQNEFHVRQYNVMQWFNEVSRGSITVTDAVVSSRDIYQIAQPTVPAGTSGCAAYHNLFKQSLPSNVAAATYDSYIWVTSLSMAGCTFSDNQTSGVIAEQGPCGSGGCKNFFSTCPYVPNLVYALGKNFGLKRSNSRSSFPSGAIVEAGDLSCVMGKVLDYVTAPGCTRRGFNALQLMRLGVISAVESSSLASPATFVLSQPYVNDAVVGRTRLVHISNTPYYLSFRSPVDPGPDRNANFGKLYQQSPLVTKLTGNVHVHELLADGTTVFAAVINAGQSLNISYGGTNFWIRHYGNTNTQCSVGFSTTSAVPTTPVIQPDPIPSSGVIWQQQAVLDAGQQGSVSGSSVVLSYPTLSPPWVGDDQSASAFVRLQLSIPKGATIVSATLLLESSAEQMQSLAGNTVLSLSVENVDNAQSLSGNVLGRSQWTGAIPYTATGTYDVADEIPITITSLVQAQVNRINWVPGNFIVIRISSGLSSNQNTKRTFQSGISCAIYGGSTPCAPRLRLDFTTSGGAPQPTPVNCVTAWTAFSTCSGPCGSTGSQFSNEFIVTPAANGGVACPNPLGTITQPCTTAACSTSAPQPTDCQYTYSSWSTCSGPCSSTGTRTRSIIILAQPTNGGAACPTQLTQTQACTTTSCPPQDCLVSWSDWTTCSGGVCGGSGSQSRFATVQQQALYGGTPCPTLTQSRSCSMPACLQDCIVSCDSAQWSSCIRVESCPSSNNAGVQQKVCSVIQEQIGMGAPCGAIVQTRSCTASSCVAVDCAFTWSDWSVCVGNCGTVGTQYRYATIYAQPQSGGAPCPRPTTQRQVCSNAPCGSTITTGPFIQSAIVGSITDNLPALDVAGDFMFVTVQEQSSYMQARWLIYPPTSGRMDLLLTVGGQGMVGPFIVSWAFSQGTLNDVLTVNSSSVQSYRVNLASTNSVRQVVQVQLRNVDHVTPRNSPTRALVDYLALQNFETSGVAPIDCQQTSLTLLSPCSAACGTGTICFSRTTLVQPANGGRACEPSTVCTSCNDATGCVVDCVVSPYGPPSACSVTCGTGFQVQTATVITPPQNGGTACPPLTTQSFCFMPDCPANQDCAWGNWSSWSTCTAPCNGGTQTRTRTIQTPQAGNGTACTGSSSQTQTCNTQSCTGVVHNITVQSFSQSSGGYYYQRWPTTAVSIPGQSVQIFMSGTATDPSATTAANGFYELSSATSSCTFAGVPTMQCPRGTPFASLNGYLGAAKCTGSSSTTATGSAFVTFVINC